MNGLSLVIVVIAWSHSSHIGLRLGSGGGGTLTHKSTVAQSDVQFRSTIYTCVSRSEGGRVAHDVGGSLR